MSTNLETQTNYETSEMEILSELGDLDNEIRGNDKDQNKKKESKINTHGMLSVGTAVSGDFAEVLSDKAALTAVVDVSHKKSGLGVSVVRVDDFDNNPEYPFSKVTLVSSYWSKKFGKNKNFGVKGELKKTFFDNKSEANGIYPDVVGSYSKNGRTFEGMYAHKFKDGPDSDAFRLSVTKKIDEVLSATTQWWYETGYDKKHYGRLTLNANLGNGIGAQIGCVVKYGKIVPTICALYKF